MKIVVVDVDVHTIVPTLTPIMPKLDLHAIYPQSKILLLKELRHKAFSFGTNLVFI